MSSVPTLIGYFPKRTAKRPDWLKNVSVDELCSVSTCISKAPAGWIDQWRHNDLWVYDTPEKAWSVVPESARHEFDLYAYQIFPVVFTEGQQKPFAITTTQVQPLHFSFEKLGCDAVSRSCGTSFECSPLSCNHKAEEISVNRFCLVDEAETAFRLAAKFEAEGCEPGPYFVVEVWRQKHVSWQSSSG